MKLAIKHFRLNEVPGQAVDGIELVAHDRHLRRKVLLTENGQEVLVDLPLAIFIQDGDHLELDDGSYLEVRAAEEELLEITPVGPAHLALLAWHIGNRHIPAQIEGNRILILNDRVIGLMLQQLGAKLSLVTEQFQPEHGAYAHGH